MAQQEGLETKTGAYCTAKSGDSDDKGKTYGENSAQATALGVTAERELRVPCYCEENVWRLAFRRLRSFCDEQQSPKNRTHSKRANISSDKSAPDGQYFVVFISNKNRCCPMQYQLAGGENRWKPCFWDYHVVCLKGGMDQSWILDMDSHLPFPSLVGDYLQSSFNFLERVEGNEYHEFAPMFRVVPAELFLKHFYSDRMHMYDSSTGRWSAVPPTYDCIMDGLKNSEQSKSIGDSPVVKGTGVSPSKSEAKEVVSNLDSYVDMMKRSGHEGENGIYGQVFTLDEFRARYSSSSAELSAR